MKSIFKRIVFTILPREFVEKLSTGNKSYSQEGEDVVLNRIFDKQSTGFYVDIGAHHPKRFSNTYFFYQKGWRGINIDPLPGVEHSFKEIRPRDIFISAGISDQKEELKYYQFKEPAFNTFDEVLAEERKQKSEQVGVVSVPCFRIDELLHQNDVSSLDFMSIDVEGFEMNVLNSNDWDRYVPKVIVVEILDFDFLTFPENPIYQFLASKGYFIFSKLFHSVVFVHHEYSNLVKR